MVDKKYITIGVVFVSLLVLLAGCSPSYTVIARQTSLSDFVGETVALQVDYSATRGTITSPQLIPNCENVIIQSQSYTSENQGTITADLLIKDYRSGTNCFTFKSNEYQEPLFVSVNPQQQATIKNVDYPKKISYNSPAKFTVNTEITQQVNKLKVELTSSTPNLKFLLQETSIQADINSGVIEFNVGDFQDSAKPSGYILLQSTGFPSVNLQPISFDLYLEKDGEWLLLDQTKIDGITAS